MLDSAMDPSLKGDGKSVMLSVSETSTLNNTASILDSTNEALRYAQGDERKRHVERKQTSLCHTEPFSCHIGPFSRHSEPQGEVSHLESKNNLHHISWKEFKIGELFEISTTKKKFNAVDLEFNGIYPYVARGDKNNGIRGYINENIKFLNPANTISFGQDTATIFYQKDAYFTGNRIKIFTFKFPNFNALIANFLIARMKKAFSAFSWGSSSFEVSVLKDTKITLPVCENGEIAFDFMESFIRELESERVRELDAYLKVSGLSDYTLNDNEKEVLKIFNTLDSNKDNWGGGQRLIA